VVAATVILAEISMEFFRTLLTPGLLTVVLFVIMSAELGTCYHRSVVKKDWWRKNITTKLMIFGLVVVAFVLDATLIIISSFIRNQNVTRGEFPIWGAGFLPITIITLVWLITAEALQTTHNIGKKAGFRYVAPVILWAVKQLRKADAMRVPEGMTMNKRMLDRVTQEDIELLLEKLDERDLLDPPPDEIKPHPTIPEE
jgi:hypothetical protein